ncbi:MAG: thiamine phosphate synthase [Cyclobacteriaceae bacterium]
MKRKRKISSGVYLVIDPSLDETVLTHKLKIILQEKIVAVQIWDNFSPQQNTTELIQNVTKLCHEKNVPVLINNKWKWLNTTDLDGVHFDCIPNDFEHIKKTINRGFISGLTCNNDLSLVHWANNNHADYISFCSIFPSTTNSCELVRFETIQEAKKITSMPVFLAGGIKPENMPKLAELSFDGIAVISGIMSSEKPNEAIKAYLKQLNANKV